MHKPKRNAEVSHTACSGKIAWNALFTLQLQTATRCSGIFDTDIFTHPIGT